jgi:hypothetical protein
MAALTLGINAVQVSSDGMAERVTLYALRKVTAGDTLDLSTDFNPPIAACLIGTAGAAAGASALATMSGNSITIPAGPSNSAGFLLVYGVHA